MARDLDEMEDDNPIYEPWLEDMEEEEDDNEEERYCLNCGVSIRRHEPNVEFCCKDCFHEYNDISI